MDITNQDIALAATNDPILSNDEYVLEVGGKTFTVVYLKYREQIKFLALLQPLMETVAGKLVGIDAGLTAAALIRHCSSALPEMSAIVCRQSCPTITAEELMDLEGVTPFKLASVVIAQIKRNQMLEEIVDFFNQMLPLLKMTKKVSTTSNIRPIR